MIPILYESGEMSFVSNGICRLYQCSRFEVVEERNNIYECDFDYPVDGANFSQIKCGRIVAAWHDDTKTIQPFDIVSCSKPIDGVVTFHGVHVSYRQTGMTVYGSAINSLSDALALLATAKPSNPFTYKTDITSAAWAAAFDGTPRSVRQLLGGVDGSILDTYGGEYEWDMFTVSLLKNRGQRRDFTIRYGVNLVDYKEDVDYLGTYSACIPFWKGNENGVDTIVIGDQVDTGAVTYNGRNDCVPLDLTDKFEAKPTKAALESMAQSLMTARHPYLPSQSITVDFVRLQDMGYSELDNLMQCNLCDIITVVFPKYNMRGDFKIVKVVYDALEERYKSMELGTLSVSLSEALGISNGLGGSSGGGGGDKEVNFIVPTSAAWTSVTDTWTPDGAGIATVRINPSSSSAAYIIIRDTTNGNKVVCQIYTTNGGGASGTFPVIAGHTYSVGSKSTNVTSMEVYYYKFS